MGILNPILLLLGLAAAVPIVLHLFQRQPGPRIVFPALRYLRRAEKESARRIRLRQLLLLALRVAAVLLLALAAAQPFVRSGTADHEPTAVAIVLDNSLSTSLVLGETRLLDELKDRALETLERARSEDRFWLIRAGSPWEPVLPGTAEEVAERVRETQPSTGAADLPAAIERARSVLEAGAEGRATEVHVLTDLQATGLAAAAEVGEGGPPVIVWAPEVDVPANVAVTAVEIEGGLSPRAGERSTITVMLEGGRAGDTVSARLSLDGRVSAAVDAPVGATAVLPFPARAAGLVSGWIEIDPDPLRGDDRRYFVTRPLEPPVVAVDGVLPFIDEALDVLAEAGRIRRGDERDADVVIAPGASGAEAVGSGRAVVVFAPSTPLEIPAANRRLAAAGVPWRFTAPVAGGEARLDVEGEVDALAGALADVRVRLAYGLEADGTADADTVLLALSDGSAWIVGGEHVAGGRYLIVASPMDAEATSLPTSTGLVPLLDRLLGTWARGEPPRLEAAPGESIRLPVGATAVLRPDGGRDAVSSGARYQVPGEPGIYTIFADRTPVSAFAVNPPARESRLVRADRRALEAALPGWDVDLVHDASAWEDAIFRKRLGREAWRPLVLAALVVLILEALVAASGLRRTRGETDAADRATTRSAGGTGMRGLAQTRSS